MACIHAWHKSSKIKRRQRITVKVTRVAGYVPPKGSLAMQFFGQVIRLGPSTYSLDRSR